MKKLTPFLFCWAAVLGFLLQNIMRKFLEIDSCLTRLRWWQWMLLAGIVHLLLSWIAGMEPEAVPADPKAMVKPFLCGGLIKAAAELKLLLSGLLAAAGAYSGIEQLLENC